MSPLRRGAGLIRTNSVLKIAAVEATDVIAQIEANRMRQNSPTKRMVKKLRSASPFDGNIASYLTRAGVNSAQIYSLSSKLPESLPPKFTCKYRPKYRAPIFSLKRIAGEFAKSGKLGNLSLEQDFNAL